MIAALRGEYRKLVTTRMWWVLLLTMAGYTLFLGAMMAFVLTTPGATGGGLGGAEQPVQPEPLEVARSVYSLAAALAYVFPVVVGAMAMTGEFRHKTITPTLLVEPRRTLVLGAKMAAAVPVGLLFGLAGTLGATLGGAGVLALRGEPTFLGDGDVLRTVALSVVALTVWAVVGVGFGTALPSQVGAVVVLLAFTQFLEPLLRLLLATSQTTADAARWLPGAAGESITGASLYSSFGAGGLLPWWQGLLVLLGYGVLLAVLGRVTTLRRDVT